MNIVSALVSGLLFGLGLAISGMTLPAKVVGFLDVGGAWDPSLAFVMGGALAVFAPVYFLVRPRLQSPVLAPRFDLPTKTGLTPRLAIGATLFGAGWGLVGYCPGTVITALPTGSPTVLLLVVGVFAGILATWGAQSALTSQDVQIKADF